MKEVKEILSKYMLENELEENVKRGHCRLDPLIGKLVGGTSHDQKEVKKDFIFKNLNGQLINCHLVTLVDETQLVADSEK